MKLDDSRRNAFFEMKCSCFEYVCAKLFPRIALCEDQFSKGSSAVPALFSISDFED